jgi:hypothetical protein
VGCLQDGERQPAETGLWHHQGGFDEDLPVKLGKSYDVLIHLHRVTAAHLLL